MADVINATSYERIAGYYAAAHDSLLSIADNYEDAVYEIVILDDLYPTLDLIDPFYSAWVAGLASFSNPTLTILNAVKALQRHVVRRSGEDTVDDWITSAGVSGLDQTFADLSELAGYPITQGLS